MARFEYLEGKKKKGKARHDPPSGVTGEPAEAVYLRKETIRAAWREYRKEGGESLSELIDDLLLKWLRDRA